MDIKKAFYTTNFYAFPFSRCHAFPIDRLATWHAFLHHYLDGAIPLSPDPSFSCSEPGHASRSRVVGRLPLMRTQIGIHILVVEALLTL